MMPSATEAKLQDWMKPYEDEVVTVAVQTQGLRHAIERLEHAASNPDSPVETYLPLFEALNWIVALDDRIGAIWRPDGKKLGEGWRDKVKHGDIIVGLDWVRDVVHHQWADALQLDPVGHGLYPSEELFPSDDLYLKHDHAWVWRPVDELPKRKPRKRRKKTGLSDDADPGKTAYCEQLVGRPASDTLRDGLESCAWVARLLEPQRLR
jgi:hypothetical protein